MPQSLTARQEAFCRSFARHGIASQAYREAGYRSTSPAAVSGSSARMLSRASIRRRIHELTGELASSRIVQAQEAQERLSAIIRGEPVDDGAVPSLKDRLKAMELLGRMQGLFLERHEVDIRGVVPVVLVDDVDTIDVSPTQIH